MKRVSIADAWSGGRNNFNLIRLFAAWLVIYGHAWAITGSSGGDLVTWLTQFKFAGGVAVDVDAVAGHPHAEGLMVAPVAAQRVVAVLIVIGPRSSVRGWL